MDFDPASYLQTLSQIPDDEIDVAPSALALAALTQPGINLDRYFNHLKKLTEDVAARHKELLDSGAEDNAETQLAALKHIIADKQGYLGDERSYDDIQNANLIRVIDRRKGMPISLSILCIHAAEAQGWDVAGLDMPGHFVCRLEKDGRRIIFDPFEGFKVLGAPDLRALIKRAQGPHAELSASYYEAVKARDILVRLQNNIKFRQIESEDYEGALQTVESMRLFAPDEYRLLLDAGVLYARTKKTQSAIDALEEYIKLAPNDRDRYEAAQLLDDLKSLS